MCLIVSVLIRHRSFNSCTSLATSLSAGLNLGGRISCSRRRRSWSSRMAWCRSPSLRVKRPPGARKLSKSARSLENSASRAPRRTVLAAVKSRQATTTVAAPPRSARMIPAASVGPSRSRKSPSATSPPPLAATRLALAFLLATAGHQCNLLTRPFSSRSTILPPTFVIRPSSSRSTSIGCERASSISCSASVSASIC